MSTFIEKANTNAEAASAFKALARAESALAVAEADLVRTADAARVTRLQARANPADICSLAIADAADAYHAHDIRTVYSAREYVFRARAAVSRAAVACAALA